jgi:rubredoxin
MVPPAKSAKKVSMRKSATPVAAKKKATTVKKTESKPKASAARKPTAVKKTALSSPAKKAMRKPSRKKETVPAKKGKYAPIQRYRCRICGYIYSPLRGEPHNGIPEGTAFDDLPNTYVCPVCGQQGKGKIGKWGFEEWRPTRYICSICGYVYDEKRGEPHRGIKAGTKFEDLPDDYTCPVCAIDPNIRVRLGKIYKQGFEPLQTA